jgi:hypothetical protein
LLLLLHPRPLAQLLKKVVAMGLDKTGTLAASVRAGTAKAAAATAAGGGDKPGGSGGGRPRSSGGRPGSGGGRPGAAASPTK